MLGLRNMYRVFRESRRDARKETSLAVIGETPEARRLANVLDAQRSTGGAEIVLDVARASGEGLEVSISGKAVEEKGTHPLSNASREAVLAELAPRIVASLEEEHVVALGRGYPIFRRAVSDEVIHKNARQNAVIGALPIPGADMPAITANQGRMVLSIAAIYGEELSLERARELLGVLALGFGFRALTRQVVKLVPVGGWAAAAAIAYAGTLAMGRAAVLYFERGKKELESGQLAEIQRRAAKEARNFVSRMRRR